MRINAAAHFASSSLRSLVRQKLCRMRSNTWLTSMPKCAALVRTSTMSTASRELSPS
jgi:hypothetical protein